MKKLIFTLLVLSIVYANDYKVDVYLQNGVYFTGVVQQGKFVQVQRGSVTQENKKIQEELFKKKVYIPTKDLQRSRFGMRLWYVNQANGYIYISYKSIQRIVLRGKAENVEEKVSRKTQQLKKQFVKRLEQRNKKRQKRLEQEEKKLEKQNEIKTQQEALALTKEEKQILKDFPPGDEWSEDEREKIHKQLNNHRNNFTVRNINGRRVIQKNRFGGVNGKERTFYKKYDLWLKAYKKQQKLDALKKQGKKIEDALPDSGREQKDEEEK